MKFRDSTPTTNYVTQSSMLIESDWRDEQDCPDSERYFGDLPGFYGLPKLSVLIRLQYAGLIAPLSELQSSEVASLQTALGIKAESTHNFNRYGPTRQYGERVVLRHPFGDRYTELETSIQGYQIDQTGELWDNNPIEVVTLNWGYSDKLGTLAELRSNRLGRADVVAFNGLAPHGIAAVIRLLMGLGESMACRRLIIPRLPETPGLTQILKRTWVNLVSVDTPTRRRN